MPTKKKRQQHLAENLPATMTTEEVCPAVFTAQQVKDKRPEVYAKVVQGLVEGMTVRAMKKKFQVSHNIIAVIRTREAKVIESSRAVLKGLVGVAAQATVERYLEKIEADEIPAGVLPIACGIMLDKAARDAGEPTQTIKVERAVTLDQVKAELDAMKKAEVVEAEVEILEPKPDA